MNSALDLLYPTVGHPDVGKWCDVSDSNLHNFLYKRHSDDKSSISYLIFQFTSKQANHKPADRK